MKPIPHPNRPGFTMVELLMVIVVLGLLAALLLPALSKSITTARVAVVAMEITQLDSALEAYKVANAQEYPPDFFNFGTNNNASWSNVENHLRRVYPRKGVAVTNLGNIQRTSPFPTASNVSTFNNLDPAEALCFWLSLTFANPNDPLTNSNTTNFNSTPTPNGTMKTYFDFDQGRFADVDNDGWPEYYPKFGNGNKAPYVYFHNQTYTSTGAVPAGGFPANSGVTAGTGVASSNYAKPATAGTARPYLSISNGATIFANPARFQIIWAGMDSSYGTDLNKACKLFPSQTLKIPMYSANISADDRDNVTNFSDGRTLTDSQP